MRVDLLSTIITVAGLIFFTISLAIILLGKRVGEKDSGQQTIKVGKYIELSTNSVLTLVLITACFSIAPLAFTYWKPELSNYIPKDELSRSYLAIKDLSVIIHGAVVLEDGRFADNVKITVIRSYKQSADTLGYQTGEQGDFYIELEQPKPKETYTITWARPGYAKKTLRFGFNEIPFPLILNKEGGN
jgi:hypothetical protein